MSTRQSKRKILSRSNGSKKARAADDPEYQYFDAEAYGFTANQNELVDAAPLSWRLDGSDSLSDWTIVITIPTDEGAAATTTYHVHKNILAVGPNRSDYFASLFKSRADVSELSNSTSNIELEKSAADAFPTMLDYIYSHEGSVVFTTTNAVAVRYLAQYFQIRSLFILVTDFIKRDLIPKTSPTYLLDALTHQDEKLATAAEEICAKKMGMIDAESFFVLSPELLKRIFASENLLCDSKHLSEIVSAYCEAHADGIDKAMFAMMTDEGIMPEVEPKCALSLLKTLVKVTSSNQVNTLTESSIKTRCMEALSESWDELIVPQLQGSGRIQDEGEQAIATHKELPQEFQIELLETSLCAARDQNDREIKRLNKRIKRRDETIRQRDETIRRLKDDSYYSDSELSEILYV